MPAMLMRLQRVEVDMWHETFHRHVDVRRAHGAVTEVILLNALRPNEVWVLIEWDDLDRAQLFARSDDLLDQLDQAGIELSPDVWFLEPFAPPSEPPANETAPEGGTPHEVADD